MPEKSPSFRNKLICILAASIAGMSLTLLSVSILITHHEYGSIGYSIWAFPAAGIACAVILAILFYYQSSRTTSKLVAQLKSNEEQLALTNKNFELAVKSSGAGTIFYDCKKNIIEWDDRSLAIFGFTREEFNGTFSEWESRLHPDGKEATLKEFKQQVDTGNTIDLRYRILLPNEEIRYIWATATVVRDEKNQPARITGLHFDETKLRLLQNQNCEFRERIDLAAKSARLGVWDFDLRKNRLSWDRWMYELYGYDADTPEDPFLLWQKSIHPEDASLLENEVKKVLAGEKDYDVQFRINLPNGEIRHIKGNATTIRKQDGTPVRMIGVNYDISNQKQLEVLLTRAKRAAENANLAKSEFLANMSHEIRTPMNAILGFAEILQSELVSPEHKEWAEAISSSGDGLLELINDVLDLSKIEAKKMSLNPVEVGLNDCLEDVRILFQNRFEKKGLLLSFETDPLTPNRLIVDRTRLRQVLVNLLGNAYKFTDTGSIVVKVKSVETPRDHSKQLSIEVADTGIGIPPAELEKVFAPFEQVDGQDEDKYGGTGLGLTICKEIISMMDGSISVNSQYGNGCVFSIQIPLIQPETPAPNEAKQPSNSGLGKQQKKALVMMVEDHEINRGLIKTYVEEYPFEIVEAHDGMECLELLETVTPDLILMDLKMPQLSGHETTRRIRKNPELEKIPIIAMTASALSEDFDYLEKNYCSYLLKPFNRDDLLSRLDQALSQSS